MEAAGFDMQRYTEMRKERREKERKQAEEPEKAAEEQVPGQMEMDLTPAKPEAAGNCDQVKMMRFLAGRMDRLEEKLADCSVMVDMKTIQLVDEARSDLVLLTQKIDKLNDTLSMILRAVRKE